MIFGKKDTDQLEKIGISLTDFERQIELIARGMDGVKLISAATLQNGIIKVDDEEVQRYLNQYGHPQEKLEVIKFVPASGAATRMFKDLILFFNEKSHNKESEAFFNQIEKFPFYEALKRALPEDIKKCKSDFTSQLNVAEKLLFDRNFSYTNLPKGMIPFHKVDNEIRSAFEEHYIEASNHACRNKSVRLHFTVSLAYRDIIKELIAEVKEKLNQPSVSVSYSLQSQSTDTIALTADSEIVRDAEGNMIFRPGGHGSLLKNLNNIHADLIFVRNIDNVIPEENKIKSIQYEKVMAGYLLEQKSKRDELLLALEEDPTNIEFIEKALDYISSELKNTCRPYQKGENKYDYVKKCLNRPMRICGMVKNEGEPGGGPFFVEKDGNMSLQIIESSQIDKQDAEQQIIMESATHFNPVDMVCATRDHHAEKYNLMTFRDVDTSFISNKTYEGQSIKALEWPGLWNGAMYNWITFFMEIPLEAFNPVKTVNDLLRKNHQPSAI